MRAHHEVRARDNAIAPKLRGQDADAAAVRNGSARAAARRQVPYAQLPIGGARNHGATVRMERDRGNLGRVAAQQERGERVGHFLLCRYLLAVNIFYRRQSTQISRISRAVLKK
jgi:hypothetical protein